MHSRDSWGLHQGWNSSCNNDSFVQLLSITCVFLSPTVFPEYFLKYHLYINLCLGEHFCWALGQPSFIYELYFFYMFQVLKDNNKSLHQKKKKRRREHFYSSPGKKCGKFGLGLLTWVGDSTSRTSQNGQHMKTIGQSFPVSEIIWWNLQGHPECESFSAQLQGIVDSKCKKTLKEGTYLFSLMLSSENHYWGFCGQCLSYCYTDLAMMCYLIPSQKWWGWGIMEQNF